MSLKLDYTNNAAQSYYYENMADDDTRSLGKVIFGWVINLGLLVSVLYGAIFYLPAYFDVGRTFGFVSQDTSSLPHAEAPEYKGKSASQRKIQIRQGYLQAGQGLKVDYSLPPGTKMEIELAECTSPVFMDVFVCNPLQKNLIPINDRGPSAKSFIVRTTGFYHYKETLLNADGTPSDAPYMIKWSRKFYKRKGS